MRTLALALVVLGSVPVAKAAMMPHGDLTSLALGSTVIVRAVRTGGPDEAAAYRVDRVLGGRGLAAGQSITIDRRLYRDPPNAAPVAYLFLVRREGQWLLVPSGLRAIAGGRAYRFEQHDNPGPYVAVRQGRDPEDARWEEIEAHHASQEELERAIERDVARADRARAAIARRDVAAVLALLPPARDPALLHLSPLGFYRDTVAHRAYRAFVEAGAIDAALDVSARARGLRPTWPPIEESELLRRAADETAPLARRVVAVELLDVHSDRTLTELVALARGDAPGPVRAAAIRSIARVQHTSSSEPGWAAVRRRAGREIAALVRRLPREREASVRAALLTVAMERSLPLGRGTDPLAVIVARDGDRALFEITSRPGAIRRVALVRPDGSECASPMHVGHSSGTWHGAFPLGACPPDAELLVETEEAAAGRRFPLGR